ncbi:MAG: ATP-binding protein [Salinigranum sp.]
MTRDDAFVRETRDHLRTLTNGLVDVERGAADRERIADLLRTAHTLKGNCGVAGLDGASRLAHAVEDLLSALGDGSRSIPPELIDAALSALDDVDSILAEYAADGAVTVDPEPSVATLRERIGRFVAAAGDPPASTPDRSASEAGGTAGDGTATAEFDASVEEALAQASEFDDLEALLGEMDDGDEVGDEVGEWGSFDDEPGFEFDQQVDAPGAADGEPSARSADVSGGGGPADSDGPAGRSAAGAAGTDPPVVGREDDGDDETTPGFADGFEAIRDDVEGGDLDDLQRDIDAAQFGEFDDDDDLTIQELIEGDLTDDAADGAEAASADAADAVDAEDAADAVAAEGAVDAEDAVDVGDAGDPASARTAPGETARGSDDDLGRGTGHAAESSVDADGPPSTEAVGEADGARAAAAEAGAEDAAEATTETAEGDPDASVAPGEDAPGTVAADTGDGTAESGGPDAGEGAVADAEPDAVDAAAEPDAVDAAAEPGDGDDSAEPDAVDAAAEPGDGDDAGPAPGDRDDVAGAVDVGVSEAAVDADQSDPGDGAASAPTEGGLGADPFDDVAVDEGAGGADPDAVDLPEVDAFEAFDPDLGAFDGEGPGFDGVDAGFGDGDEGFDGAGADDVGFVRDEDTVEFESRFLDRFVDAAEVAGAVPLVQRAATTIEESDLDGDRFFVGTADRDRPGPSRRTDPVESISVDVDNVDTLLNLVEDLALTQLDLERRAEGDGVEETLSALDSVTADLRKTVMDLRLMPLSTVVGGLPRAVRDIARAQDKRVSFEVDDEGVHLDRGIVDRLGDPLVHLVRNAVDHGIEPPDERVRKNKSREGTVALRARRDRDRAIIEVEDDGRGIGAEAIRARAVEADVVTEAEADSMPLNEVYDLIFEPGFSTAEEVTEVSGRGVGMDVVARAVSALDGSVEVRSEPDAGTTVRLTLPVSVAISEVLFVSAGGERFGLPVSAVAGVAGLDELTVEDGAVTDWGDDEVVGWDAAAAGIDSGGHPVSTALRRASDPVPLVDLGEAMEAPGAAGSGEAVVRVDPEARPLALRCDEIHEAREVVVRPYEGLLGGVPGVSGATALGDGRLVNVIDVTTL